MVGSKGSGGVGPCGPGPMPGPPVPPPFDCHVVPMLMTDPVKPVPRSGNGVGVTFPAGSVPVQLGAYEEFAPDPAFDGTNQEPRRALYLVRMVVDDAVNCPDCRGWLVVGRLDPTPSPSASPTPLPAAMVRSADELETLLDADRASWVGRAVLVDGHVVTGSDAAPCKGSQPCSLGTLEGTAEQVVASRYTKSQLLPDTDYPTNGVMAMLVRKDGLEYLGWMGYNDDNTFNFTVDELRDPQHMARGPETVIVSGWLIDTPGAECPAHPTTAPPNTPFVNCPWAWLTADEEQPVSATSNGTTISPPPHAIAVQPGAYAEFAPDPQAEMPGLSDAPRQGTYLVRLVSWPVSSERPARGWQVVGRLDP